jgi:hypothetical protein
LNITANIRSPLDHPRGAAVWAKGESDHPVTVGSKGCVDSERAGTKQFFMPRRPAKRKPAKPRPRRNQPGVRRPPPILESRQRWQRLLRTLPATLQVVVLFAVCAGVWFALNWGYQVVRKPSELLFPVSGAFYKTPEQTWDRYAGVFRRHATSLITPQFLAALAQVEGSGNPVVRTYWRWSFNRRPFDIYRPASSAVGMYQMTDGTFAEARRYCVHDHRVVEDGPWHDWNSCWFTSLYTRVIPSHAVELTSAYLDRRVRDIVARRNVQPSSAQLRELAAVIHLCGAGAGARHASRSYRLTRGQRCGDHDVRAYVNRDALTAITFSNFSKPFAPPYSAKGNAVASPSSTPLMWPNPGHCCAVMTGTSFGSLALCRKTTVSRLRNASQLCSRVSMSMSPSRVQAPSRTSMSACPSSFTGKLNVASGGAWRRSMTEARRYCNVEASAIAGCVRTVTAIS